MSFIQYTMFFMLNILGSFGEHLAIHHQGRLLFMGKAEECSTGGAPVQASREKNTNPAQRFSAFRYKYKHLK